MSCIFCQKSEHTLNKCKRFMEKTVPDIIKFVQTERLCFGCLKSGHHSKNCNSRRSGDLCHERHPTCLQAVRPREEQNPPQAKQIQSREKPSTIEERYSRKTSVHSTQRTHSCYFKQSDTGGSLHENFSCMHYWILKVTQPSF